MLGEMVSLSAEGHIRGGELIGGEIRYSVLKLELRNTTGQILQNSTYLLNI